MKPVFSILEVHPYYEAMGVSFIYEPLCKGDQPQRKTFLFLRDGAGNVMGSILRDAAEVMGVMQ